MAFKAINNIISPKGLVPTLLIFSAYLYIVKFNPLAPIVA